MAMRWKETKIDIDGRKYPLTYAKELDILGPQLYRIAVAVVRNKCEFKAGTTTFELGTAKGVSFVGFLVDGRIHIDTRASIESVMGVTLDSLMVKREVANDGQNRWEGCRGREV